jgi:hypothetical protein
MNGWPADGATEDTREGPSWLRKVRISGRTSSFTWTYDALKDQGLSCRDRPAVGCEQRPVCTHKRIRQILHISK